jgi:hypothetical protein
MFNPKSRLAVAMTTLFLGLASSAFAAGVSCTELNKGINDWKNSGWDAIVSSHISANCNPSLPFSVTPLKTVGVPGGSPATAMLVCCSK